MAKCRHDGSDRFDDGYSEEEESTELQEMSEADKYDEFRDNNMED